MAHSEVHNDVRLPVTAAQLGVWVAQLMEPESPLYQCAVYYESGPLDAAVLQSAVTLAVAESEALRAGFGDDGEVFALVRARVDDTVTSVDMRSEADPRAAARAWTDRDLATVADLAEGPLFRHALIQLSDTRHLLYLRYHHIVMDGFGQTRYVARLAEIYSALLSGAAVPPCRYHGMAELLTEEAAYRESPQHDRDRRFLLERMRGADERQSLTERGATPAPRALRRQVELPPELTAALTRVGYWPAVMAAATACYLHRMLSAADVVLGVPVAARRSPAALNTPSMLANDLPLRLTVTPDTTFASLVAQTRGDLGDLLRAQRFRREDLHEALALSGTDGGLFGTLVNTMSFGTRVRFGDVTATGHQLSNGPVADFALNAYGDPADGGGVVLEFAANPKLYTEAGLAAHEKRFLTLLGELAAAPNAPLGRAAVLDATIRAELAARPNDTAGHVPGHVVDLFEAQAACTPDAVAVRADEVLTYAELDARANRLARLMVRAGIGTERLVAVALPRTAELLVTLLAVLKTGGAYLPVDPEHPADRVAMILDDARPDLLVTVAGFAPRPAGLPVILLDETDLDCGDAAPVGRARRGDTTAYVIYTSGSTGRPKGVVLERAALDNFLEAMRRVVSLGPDDSLLAVTTVSFDIAVLELFLPLLHGATVVLAGREQVLDPEALRALVEREGITVIQATPSLWQALAEDRPHVLAGVRVLTGGEALPKTLAARLAKHAGSVTNMYGPTETTVWSMTAPVDGGPVTLGTPILNTQVYVLDAALQPVAPGLAGELYIAGDGVARGYNGRPDLTAERFVANPYGRGRLYRTGDLVRHREDGGFTFLSRVDHQVKVRGFRIELGDIEAALLDHPPVERAVVVLREDGPGDGQLVAYVVSAEGDSPRLRRALADRLPEYMMPSAIVALDALPLTPNGKIDRRALPAPVRAALPDGRAPRTPIEEHLCQLYAQALGLDGAVTIDDDFFTLGGTSLSATRVVAQAAREGLRVPVRDLFKGRTPARLAPSCRADTAAAELPQLPDPLPADETAALLADAATEQVLPLTPLQEGLLVHSAFATGGDDVYTVQLRLDLHGELDADRLRTAIDAVLARHPVLRSAVLHEGISRPVLAVRGTASVPWRTYDLRGRVDDAAQVARDERDEQFDLTAAPLLRAALLRLDDGHRLLLTCHHLILDGWSVPVVVRDVLRAYAGSGAGPAPRPYRDHLALLAGHDRAESVRVWSHALVDARPTLVATSAEQSPATAVLRLEREFDAATTARLTSRARDLGVTVNSLVQAGWAVALRRLTGRAEVLFGITVAGRPAELPGVEDMAGLFANTVPLRARSESTQTLAELARALQDDQADLLAHQYLPLVDIQRAAGVPNLFDTLVVFENYPVDREAINAAAGSRGLTLGDADLTDATHYPLALAAVPGERFGVRLTCRPDLFDAETARDVLESFTDVLVRLADEPGTRVGDLAPDAGGQHAVNPGGGGTGSADDRVELRGFRFRTADVETVLCAHPDVVRAAVTVREDVPGQRRLVGYVVRRDGTEVAEVRGFAAQSLPDYMVPSVMVAMDTLPVGPSGDIDRRALPVPVVSAADHRDPTTAQEETLCAIVADVLGVERVGVDDDFFALGGDSILAFRLLSRARTSGLAFGYRDVFERRTVAAIAAIAARHEDRAPLGPTAPLPADELARLLAEPGVTDVLPAAPNQQGLFFLHSYDDPGHGDTETDPYVLQVVLDFTGAVDLPRLREALAAVLDRHEALRVAFRASASQQTVLCVYEAPRVPVRESDVEDDDAVAAYLDEDRATRFDLSRPPLVRAAVLRRPSGAQTVALTMHHTVADGWSLPIVVRDLLGAYAGTAPTTPAPSFRGHLAWLADTDSRASLDVWRGALADVTEPMHVSAEHGTPVVEPARHALSLDRAETAALAAAARAQGVTVNAMVQAAWATVLRRLTGRDDTLFGVTVAGRSVDLRDSADMVGLFVNTVPLALRLDPGESLTALVKRLAREQSLLSDHHHVALADIQRAAGLGDLFDTLLSFENYPVDRAEIAALAQDGGLDLIGAGIRDGSHFAIGIVVEPGDEMLFRIGHQPQLVSEDTVRSAAADLLDVLRTMTKDPHRELGRVVTRQDVERRRSLLAWNPPLDRSEPATSLPELFAEQVRRTPDAPAVVADGDPLTYRQLDRRANALARELVAHGVGPGDLVAVALPRSVGLPIALLGVLKAGAAYVPVDPTYPAERIAAILADSAPRLAIASTPVSLPTDVLTLSVGDTEADAVTPARIPRRQDAAYVIFTSGSTGRPKGVVVEHQALGAYLRRAREAYPDAAGRALAHTSVSFDLTVTCLYAPLVAGGLVHIAELPDAIGTERPTFLKGTPSHLALLDTLPEEVSPSATLVLGGEALRGEMLRTWRAVHPDALVINAYGPTEATVNCMEFRLPPGARLPDGPVPLGRPFDYARAYVLDSGLGPVRPGARGELYIAGAGLARGYLGLADRTAERFVADPHGAPGTRMYRTGDLVRQRADGALEYLGRIDEQVKVRGFRIELGEIETAASQLPGIVRAVAAVHGAGTERRLVCHLVPDDGSGIDLAAVETHLRTVLPGYMVPASFVLLDEVPLTPNGKVDRAALPEPSFVSAASARAPRTPLEENLAELFRDVLRRETVGIDDDFFALGGDSIMSIQLVGRGRTADIRFSARHVFEHRTVARLAAALEAQAPVAVPGAAAAPAQVPFLPLMRQLVDRGGRYEQHHQSVVLKTPPTAEADLLPALQAVLDHHEMLRMRVIGGHRLEITATADAASCLRRVDATGRDDAEVEALAAEAAPGIRDELDPERGVVLRAVWFDRGADRPGRMLIVVHHLAIDGVSWRIVLPDLARAWQAVHEGRSVRLPAVTTSFGQWAAAFTALPADDAEYWQELLEAGDPPLGLRPLDPGRDLRRTAGTLSLKLPADVTEALLGPVPSAFHATVDDVLLTALAVAVPHWRGDRSGLLVDVESHGRAEHLLPGSDLSRTVGWFTVAHPVRFDTGAADHRGVADGTDAAGDALRTVKEQVRATPRDGIGHGLARHVARDTMSAFAGLSEAQFGFNYMGRLALGGALDGGWELAGIGADEAPDVPLTHVVELNAATHEGPDGPELVATWTWARTIVDDDAARRLAELWFEALRGLAAHGTRPGAGGRTPSDLLMPLSQEEIRELESDPDVADLLPLAPLQKGLLFHHLNRGAGHDPYVSQLSVDFHGPLDRAALRRAAAEVQRRHTALRSGFRRTAVGTTVQVVAAHPPLDWTETDLRGAQAAPGGLTALLEADRERPFDLTAPPLVRYSLVARDDAHTLVVTAHHIVRDGWSLPIMLDDLLACYRGEPLPEPRSHRDHLAWLARQDRQAARAAWRTALTGLDGGTLLAEGRAAAHRAPGLLDFTVDAVDLEATARRFGVTVNTVVQTAWLLLIARLTGRDDLVTGVTVSGRPADLPEAAEMIGLFVNTLPLHARLRAEETVVDFARRLQSEQVDLLEHHHTGLAEIQSDAGIGDLFDTAMVFENYPLDATALNESARLAGLDVGTVDHHSVTHYALALEARPAPGGGLHARVHHRRDILTPERADLVAEWFRRLLHTVAGEPRTPIGRVSVHTADEHAALLAAGHGPRDEAAAALWPELFAEQVRRTPDAPAVAQGTTVLTYRELAQRSAALAATLVRAGVGVEHRVAVALPRSADLVVAVHAVVLAGAAFVPVDPDYPAERIAHILTDASADVVVTTRTLDLPTAPAARIDMEDLDPAAQAPMPEVRVRPDQAAYIIYTSGSTGLPKGVVVTHAGIPALVRAQREAFDVDPTSRVLQFASPSFDAAVSEIVVTLLSGACLVSAPRADLLPGGPLVATVTGQHVTHATLPPAALQNLDPGLLPGLRSLAVAGEQCPPHVAERWSAGRRMINAYGPTETTVCATMSAQLSGSGVPPIGLPVLHSRVYLLDAHLMPVPTGAVGELYVSGPGLARGYLGLADRTAERFVADPFGEPGTRMYRTGDLARRLDDGTLVYFGRADRQVKLRGFRIEPGEIEAVLAGAKDVAAVAVVVREDTPGDRRLVAYVVAAEAAAPDPERIRARLRGSLPGHMVPSVVVVVERLPLTANGKLDRAALP
ncbi:amino acid adenylation domain-containing protein, partial [Streptomyces scopuliridis]